MQELLECKPIGYFSSLQSEKYMAPKQPELAIVTCGQVTLNANCNFEQALQDLQGFERIWLVYWFHRNQTWKPKVLTPRGGAKRGVFATRSPHRPNPIGMSCVELLSIDGRVLLVGKNDLLDGTPILDIKPYLTYADSFPNSRQGWVEDASELTYKVVWSELATQQAAFIEKRAQIDFKDSVALRLQNNPFPFPGHRIKKIAENEYELALKTWRVSYYIQDEQVVISKIFSGYDRETLEGKKISRWDDVPLHVEFLATFTKG